MDLQKPTRLFNLALIILAFCLIFFSIKKLNTNINFLNVNLPSFLGEISNTSNIVQIKYPSELGWQFVKDNNLKDLFVNTLVFAHKSSNARLMLKNKQEIIINSETLVKLKDEETLQIKEGSVQLKLIKNQKPIKVLIGNKKLFIQANKDTDLSINKNLLSTKLQVEKGEARISYGDASSKEMIIEQGSVAEIKSNEEVEKVILNTTFIYPRNVVYLKNKSPLNFQYESEKQFNYIHIHSDSQKQVFSIQDEIFLEGGEYLWGLSESMKTTPDIFQKFTLYKEIPSPRKLTPKNNQSLSFNELPANISFSWETKSPVLLKILDSSKKIVFSGEVSTRDHSIEITKEGVYSWSVDPIIEYSFTEDSEDSSFSILLNKRNIEYKTVLIKDSFQRFQIKLSSKIPSQSLRVIFSSDSEFSNIIHNKKILDNLISLPIKNPGNYFWKIIDKDGNTFSIRSEDFNTELKSVPPPKKAPKVQNIKIQNLESNIINKDYLKNIVNFFIPIAYANESIQKVSLNWEEIDDALKYELEIWDDKKKIKIINKLCSSNSCDVELPKGSSYSYRVRYFDEWERPSPFSEYAIIDLKYPEITPPKALTKTISPQPKKKSIPKKKDITKKKANKVTTVKQYPPKLPVKVNSTQYEVLVSHISSMFDFSQEKDSSRFLINGFSYTGHSLQIKRKKTNDQSSQVMRYNSSYGTVFNEQFFAYRQLTLGYSLQFWGQLFRGTISMDSFPTYQSQNSTTNYDKQLNRYSLGIEWELPLFVGKNHDFSSLLGLRGLGLVSYRGELNYRYFINLNFFLRLGITYENTTWDSNNVELFRALIGSGLIF